MLSGMVNYCIQAGLENNVTSRFRLTKVVYHDLMKCGVLKGVKLGSITITPTAICISYSKIVEVRGPKGWIAVDVNEDNVTAISSSGEIKVYDLSKLKKASYGYFWRKRKIQQKYTHDRRVLRKALTKLSKNHRDLVSSELHKVSANLAEWCREKNTDNLWKSQRYKELR